MKMYKQCAVKDNKGIHCKEKPEHFVKLKNGKTVELCNKCFRSYNQGQWQK